MGLESRPNSSPSNLQEASPRVYRFEGGLWFNGRSFEPRTVYSVDGKFRSKYKGAVDSTIDLQGRYVVPPFAEAHTHHFMEGMDYKAQVTDYLSRGIFYAKNTNGMRALTEPVLPYFNKPGSVDVVYSNGGLTATGGHPVQIYDYLGRNKLIPGWAEKDMPGQAYFIIDNEADLEREWPRIMAGRPDFIKTYLEYSEEYSLRKDDPKYYGQKGLNPSLLPKIVAKAHSARLRVAVHVNTSADFHNSVVAGVDEITHLPLARISEADARLAARRGVVVVTTTLSHRKTDHVKDLADIHRYNLQLLHKHGVRLAVGTDDNNRTVLDEAENLYKLKVFDNLTLLKMWTETTPQSIFPGRRIGRLGEGYEASFIALEGNPLEDFMNVKKINLRFKQGQIIKVDPQQQTARPTTKHP
jgi:imidazolonepropionase-like amidohydrolase